MKILSSTSAVETRKEYLIEEVCNALAGCWINPLTGECPECVEVEPKKPIILKKEPIVKKENNWTRWDKSEFPKEEKIYFKSKEECEVCIVGKCDWIPKHCKTKKSTTNTNLCFYPELGWLHHGKPTGEWRNCDWDVNYTAIAVKRGTIECGGYDNIEWTNSDLTEYVCSPSKKKYKDENGFEKCWFAEAGWPTGKLTEDFVPIMTGGYMHCSWRS